MYSSANVFSLLLPGMKAGLVPYLVCVGEGGGGGADTKKQISFILAISREMITSGKLVTRVWSFGSKFLAEMTL